ncbi:MAG TPA: beta-propeller domain-containing protein [Baekduia sp.]|nr:beta-propeller domain-containing protein [Baekduia sp.]
MDARRLAPLSLVVALIAALAAVPSGAGAATRQRPHLIAFDSCRALVGYAHRYAARAGGVGVPVRALGAPPQVLARPVVLTDTASGEIAPTAAPAPVGAKEDPSRVSSSTAFSGTNVQEAGIDEPDVLKTDGKHVYAAVNGQLRVLDVTGDAPRVVGSLALGDGYAHQLLLRGTRLLVLSTVSIAYAVDDVAARAAIAPVPGRSTTVLTEVDVTDPAAPKVARTMTLDGDYVDARLTGGTARVVVSSTPAPAGAVPLDGAPLRTFVPVTTIRSTITGRTYRRGVVPCDDVRRPDAFSGLGLLTVLTVDLDKGLYDVDRDAVLAGAQTVYASDKSLYVASQRYVRNLQDTADVPGAMRTEIHRFDAAQPGATAYAGSGTVPGFVVNAYAMSEQDGALRVASTDEPSWLPEGGPAEPAQSYVTVLASREGGALGQIGQVGGLGKGQRIYGVRFAGTTGYVVTFRQIDPLYTLDLSKPGAPRVVGELEIPGYSAYLHPLGDGLLLGVGQEATGTGRPQGTQVSLFDVSDLAHPKRIQHVVFGNGSSDAEFDPHAFLWWAPTRTAVLPLSTYDQSGGSFVGAVGVHVAADAMAEYGRVTHVSGTEVAPIARSLVVGDRLYTLSYLGLQANRLDTLAPLAFATFGG